MIKKEKFYTYFKNQFDIKLSKNGWYRFVNPFDNHKDVSMAVNFDYGIVKDFRTGYKEYLLTFVADNENLTYSEAFKFIKAFDETEVLNTSTKAFSNVGEIKKSIKIPEGYNSLFEDSLLAKRARTYLESRGFDSQLLSNLGFGFFNKAPYFGYIFVPFKIKGRLVYYICRDFIGNTPKYLNPPSEDILIGKSDLFFNEDALKIYDEVNLLEGWSDAMTLGKNSIASLGWSLSLNQKSKILNSRVKVLNIIPDRGYYEKALKLASEFADYIDVIKVLNFDSDVPNFDSSGKSLKDVNDVGKDLIIQKLKETKPFSYNLLKVI